jgi:uncharacterized protein YejL (UPF0352 family)
MLKFNLLIAICLLSTTVRADTEIFKEVLRNPPSHAESRVIGKRIDQMFSSIEESQKTYGEELEKINWGDVYDPDKLMNPDTLNSLIKVNNKGREKTSLSIQNKKNLIDETVKKLQDLAIKSNFAKAMLVELNDKKSIPETGFDDILTELAEISDSKHVNINKKLELLLEAKDLYRFNESGHIEFRPGDVSERIMHEYEANLVEHNKITARQRSLALYFNNNRQSIVKRFHELKGD